MNRRNFLKSLALLTVSLPLDRLFAQVQSLDKALTLNIGNFRYIFGDPKLNKEFFNFLVNVFHLYPEQEFHQLIQSAVKEKSSDEDIYKLVQSKLGEIKPIFADLSYALPALWKQKREMTRQTLELLNGKDSFHGYMEVGSTGRYIGSLDNKLNIKGDCFLVHSEAPSYSPLDIVERGQFFKIGEYVPLNNYATTFNSKIPNAQIELATVYIGFHHCPVNLREEFITNLRDTIKAGGKLILRDHDAKNEDMIRMVALAHDVFNLGTKETWNTNKIELRNFYSLEYITTFLENRGFRYEGKTLYQSGDPTKNALLSFIKV